MKVKTAELTGPALDWAVAKCEGTLGHYVQPNEKRGTTKWEATPSTRRYSTDWAQGGPIIDRERIELAPPVEAGEPWSSFKREFLFEEDGRDAYMEGPTPLVSACRCYVASKLGDEVEIPEELA